jgi:uncharacterized protein
VQLSPNTATDRQVVQRYGSGGFTVSGVKYEGSVLVLPTTTVAWQANSLATIDGPALVATLRAANVSVCLIGCGARSEMIPAGLRQAMREGGIGADVMETGAACRTYNMLAAEGRAVAAALIPR